MTLLTQNKKRVNKLIFNSISKIWYIPSIIASIIFSIIFVYLFPKSNFSDDIFDQFLILLFGSSFILLFISMCILYILHVIKKQEKQKCILLIPESLIVLGPCILTIPILIDNFLYNIQYFGQQEYEFIAFCYISARIILILSISSVSFLVFKMMQFIGSDSFNI